MIDVVLSIEHAIKWHEKNAIGCDEIAKDHESRYGKDVLERAKEAAKHHRASAAKFL